MILSHFVQQIHGLFLILEDRALVWSLCKSALKLEFLIRLGLEKLGKSPKEEGSP